jgi:hypothetical protein
MPRAPFRGDRYEHPQAWIDHVVATDRALERVRLSYPPRYCAPLTAFGQARLEDEGVPGRTWIGRKSLVNRLELLDTIIHEELNHRLWKRACRGSPRARKRMAAISVEEAYVETAANRFLLLQGRL